ncbi:IS3 family transposase, partial [Enterococcus faecium]|uniref:IS3 family transposase n=1 Tax=Enterococcus faecium TaxID=1352 RepID=UPI0002A356F6
PAIFFYYSTLFDSRFKTLQQNHFFGLLKQEIFHGKVYNCFEELKSAIDSYIYYYNNERIKQKLNWQSPVQFRKTTVTVV